MTTIPSIYVGKGENKLFLLPKMANRHGLIAGATGTCKTVSLQVLAQGFSQMGVPVFTVDVKGDLSGISQPGQMTPKIETRLKQVEEEHFKFEGCPVIFWDIFGEEGHPIRATVQEMGSLLLSRMLSLNEVQTGVLALVFKIAAEKELPLIDLKDLQAIIKYIGDNASTYTTQYGNVSTASIGAIQRALLELDEQGGAKLFGEPSVSLIDMLKTNSQGQGYVNILSAETLMRTPKIYSTFLLWLLTQLFEKLPEVGDPEKPKIIFFFDEAHLLFNDASKSLLDKIEQVVRLIRSKGVGVYLITQNPIDIPDAVLGQLGNRIQHALRAFTPRDQKAVRAAAETFRANPKIKVFEVISQLGVGEGLVSLLDEKGIPHIVERALICPPESQIGPIIAAQREQIIKESPLYGHYEKIVERESAFEKLKKASPPPEEEKRSTSKKGLVAAILAGTWAFLNSKLIRDVLRDLMRTFFRPRR